MISLHIGSSQHFGVYLGAEVLSLCFLEPGLNHTWSLEEYGRLLETGGGKERMTKYFLVQQTLSRTKSQPNFSTLRFQYFKLWHFISLLSDKFEFEFDSPRACLLVQEHESEEPFKSIRVRATVPVSSTN